MSVIGNVRIASTVLVCTLVGLALSAVARDAAAQPPIWNAPASCPEPRWQNAGEPAPLHRGPKSSLSPRVEVTELDGRWRARLTDPGNPAATAREFWGASCSEVTRAVEVAWSLSVDAQAATPPSGVVDRAPPAHSAQSAARSTQSTQPAAQGAQSAAQSARGTQPAAQGTQSTAQSTQGTQSTAQGTQSAAQRTQSATQGTQSTAQGTQSTAQGTQSAAQGTQSTAQGTPQRALTQGTEPNGDAAPSAERSSQRLAKQPKQHPGAAMAKATAEGPFETPPPIGSTLGSGGAVLETQGARALLYGIGLAALSLENEWAWKVHVAGLLGRPRSAVGRLELEAYSVGAELCTRRGLAALCAGPRAELLRAVATQIASPAAAYGVLPALTVSALFVPRSSQRTSWHFELGAYIRLREARFAVESQSDVYDLPGWGTHLRIGSAFRL